MSSSVTIASFGKPFGVRGWIKVNSYLDPKASILEVKPWLMPKNDILQEITLTETRQHADNIIVKLPGYDSPETVSKLTNIKIATWRKDMPKLAQDEHYWSELIGLKVVNLENIELGAVQDLMSTAPGANDVLIVMDGERKRLIPYISNVIKQVDGVNKIIYVDWDHAF
jgi:16S rRNA processing protein RimM